MSKIIDIAKKNPLLFFWSGPIDKNEMTEWLCSRSLSLPSDIIDFWLETGGGEVFETEDMLCPIPSQSFFLNIDDVNIWLKEQGMLGTYLAFHTGGWISAISLASKLYVALDQKTYSETGVFKSFDQWFEGVLLTEYSGRYGIV